MAVEFGALAMEAAVGTSGIYLARFERKIDILVLLLIY